MKILFDINHPHQVHFFKNTIWNLQDKGHEILISAGEKEISLYLLDAYGLKYIKAGKSVKGYTHKAYELLKKEFILLKTIRNFNPDILVSLTSASLAYASKITGKKHIAFADTESATLTFKLAIPFTEVICTPSCFRTDLGKKQIRYNGYQELAYLHPNYFRPDSSVLDEIGINKTEKFFILRFVSWTASHDFGLTGINMEMKLRIAKNLEKYGRVLITSETPLPNEFDKYRIKVAPEKMHDLLYYATLLFGESATMASECAILGTPAIYIDFTGRGYTDEEENKYRLVYNFKNDIKSQENALIKAIELIKQNNLKEESRLKSKKLIEDKIDVTKFMIEVIEKYLY
jgi:predicted glycosyltransferase